MGKIGGHGKVPGGDSGKVGSTGPNRKYTGDKGPVKDADRAAMTRLEGSGKMQVSLGAYGARSTMHPPPIPSFNHQADPNHAPGAKSVSRAAAAPLSGPQGAKMRDQAARVKSVAIGMKVQFTAKNIPLNHSVTRGMPRSESEGVQRTFMRGKQEMAKTEEFSDSEKPQDESEARRGIKRASDSQGSGAKGDTGHQHKKKK